MSEKWIVVKGREGEDYLIACVDREDADRFYFTLDGKLWGRRRFVLRSGVAGVFDTEQEAQLRVDTVMSEFDGRMVDAANLVSETEVKARAAKAAWRRLVWERDAEIGKGCDDDK